MQNTESIIRQPILIALLLSIAVHAAVMVNKKSIHTPTEPVLHIDTGTTTLRLSLAPTPTVSAQPKQPEPLLSRAPDEIQPVFETSAPPETEVVEEEEMEDAIVSTAEVPADTTDENEGVIAAASLVGEYHPVYPRISERRGEEGTVVIALQILADGQVANAEIVQSSGYRRLDAAAIKGAYKTAFTPAHRQGQPVESSTELSYTFTILHD